MRLRIFFQPELFRDPGAQSDGIKISGSLLKDLYLQKPHWAVEFTVEGLGGQVSGCVMEEVREAGRERGRGSQREREIWVASFLADPWQDGGNLAPPYIPYPLRITS